VQAQFHVIQCSECLFVGDIKATSHKCNGVQRGFKITNDATRARHHAALRRPAKGKGTSAEAEGGGGAMRSGKIAKVHRARPTRNRKLEVLARMRREEEDDSDWEPSDDDSQWTDTTPSAPSAARSPSSGSDDRAGGGRGGDEEED